MISNNGTGQRIILHHFILHPDASQIELGLKLGAEVAIYSQINSVLFFCHLSILIHERICSDFEFSFISEVDGYLPIFIGQKHMK